MTRPPSSKCAGDKDNTAPTRPSGGGGGVTAMRLVVPLQGIVQGRGGLVLGSLLPCALFYVLQLYLKRKNRSSSSAAASTSKLSAGIPRTSSRGLLSSKTSASPAPVSSRAAAVAALNDSPYSIGYKKFLEDPYHSACNPNGVMQLGLTENQLSLDLHRGWLAEKLKDLVLDGEGRNFSISDLATYQPFDGLMESKMAVAEFMSHVMQGSVSFNPSRIILTAGAASAIEILSFCLADPGNAFLVPSPYYPGLDQDIKWQTGIGLIPVPCRSTENFSLNIATLERAYNQAKKQGVKVRAVLVSNPSNPVSNLLSRETLYDLLEFATSKNIHVISDEVYGGSIHGKAEFVSIAEILQTQDFDRSRVHIIYGLSKDLFLPGLRVGVIYSFNEHVLAAASKLARFSSISAPTQSLLISVLADSKFITECIISNNKRLQKLHALFVNGLKQVGIECINSSGGFYFWVDMTKFIQPYNEKGELELWDKLLNVAKINITPGSLCHCIEPGWFRCCFTTLSEDDIPVVIDRVMRVTNSQKVHP